MSQEIQHLYYSCWWWLYQYLILFSSMGHPCSINLVIFIGNPFKLGLIHLTSQVFFFSA